MQALDPPARPADPAGWDRTDVACGQSGVAFGRIAEGGVGHLGVYFYRDTDGYGYKS